MSIRSQTARHIILTKSGISNQESLFHIVYSVEPFNVYILDVYKRQVQNIAEKIYRYIPNVFSNYDPFILSYELETLFDKNRDEFLNFYKSHAAENR